MRERHSSFYLVLASAPIGSMSHCSRADSSVLWIWSPHYRTNFQTFFQIRAKSDGIATQVTWPQQCRSCFRYLERCQDDGGAWLGTAQAQARLGHHEAAEAAWRAKEGFADVLGPDILGECAQLQFGSQQSARTRSRG